MEIVARIPDPATALALVTALRAYGFHPADIDDGGLPGVTDPFFGKGIAIRLPEDEVAEAQALVNDLLADMLKDS